MATEKKVLTNALTQFFGKFCTVATSFIIVKVLTGFGDTFYGKYLTAYEFLAFFGILADAGLFSIAVREISKNNKQNNEGENVLSRRTHETDEFIMGNIFSMRMLLIISVTLLAGLSAQFVPAYSPEVKLGIWITGISMALTIVAGTLSAILQARMKIQYFTSGLVIGKIALAALVYAIGTHAQLFGDNLLYAFLWAGVISNIIFATIVIFYARREIKIQFKFDFDWWKKILKIALPYGLALILQTLYLRIDVILISMILGAEPVGVYGVATRVMESFLILGTFFGQAILPKISAEEDNSEKASKTLFWGVEKLLIFSIPIIISTLFFAPTVVSILSSEAFLTRPGFFGSDRALMMLVPTVFFAYLNQLFTFTLVSKDRQKYLLIVNGTALLTNVILNIFFLETYGLIAATISTIICEVIVFTLLLWEIFRYFKPKFSTANLGLIFGSNSLLLLEFWIIGLGKVHFSFLSNLPTLGKYLTPETNHFIISAVVGSLTYLGILWKYRKQLTVVS